MSESFAEMFEQSQSELKMQPGQLIMGEVVQVSDDYIVVNAGLKSEGMRSEEHTSELQSH